MPAQEHTPTVEQLARLAGNRDLLMGLLEGKGQLVHDVVQPAELAIVLERFVCDRKRRTSIPFEGPLGIEAVLRTLAETYPDGTISCDGHIVGVAGQLLMQGHEALVPIEAQVRYGGQLALAVGPASSLQVLSDAVAVFDRQFHLACAQRGLDLELVARGHNPYISSPEAVRPVPTARFSLLGAYLSRRGSSARSMLRLTASTTVRIPLREGVSSARIYQTLAAAAPILAFLTDNTLPLRGTRVSDVPRMSRALLWSDTDPERSGLVPGTLDAAFSAQAYERWLEGVRPMLLTSDGGNTFSTGSGTCREVMEERVLTPGEASQLLDSAWPWVRWTAGALELLAADALPPRMALGYAALIKGLLSGDETIDAMRTLFNMDTISEEAVAQAWSDLRMLGWRARPYGRPATQVAHELASLASHGLQERSERVLLDGLTQLWDVESTPRDLLIRNQERARSHRKEQAARLWGKGAITSYEDLAGDPPPGDTARLPRIRG